MAYISPQRTREIKKELQKRFPNLKFSVRNEHFTSVDVSIISGDVDFSDILEENTYRQISHFHLERYDKHTELLKQIYEIIDQGNHYKSDPMSDYYDVGFYVHMSIGKWNKPYVYKDSGLNEQSFKIVTQKTRFGDVEHGIYLSYRSERMATLYMFTDKDSPHFYQPRVSWPTFGKMSIRETKEFIKVLQKAIEIVEQED